MVQHGWVKVSLGSSENELQTIKINNLAEFVESLQLCERTDALSRGGAYEMDVLSIGTADNSGDG